jgi:hypothetical protein
MRPFDIELAGGRHRSVRAAAGISSFETLSDGRRWLRRAAVSFHLERPRCVRAISLTGGLGCLRYRLIHVGQLQVALARLWRICATVRNATVRNTAGRLDRTSAPSIGAVSVLSRSILKQKLMGYLNQGEDILKRRLDFSFFFSARQFVFEIYV